MPTRCFMVEEREDGWHRLDSGDLLEEERPQSYWAFPVGAMRWRWHKPLDYDGDPRPMPHLAVRTPAGLFCIDCPATDEPHGHWTRTGDPPNVTVTPSINIGPEIWHGHLTAGELAP